MTTTVEPDVKPQVQRVMLKKRFLVQIEGDGHLNDTLPFLTLTRTNDQEGLYAVTDARGYYLSERGNLHPSGYSDRFMRNHFFDLTTAKKKAIAYLTSVYGNMHFVPEVVSEVFSTAKNGSPFGVYFTLQVLFKDGNGYAVVRLLDDRYLSKNGAWHVYGTTQQFKRNHYFSYDEAVERALELLPTLTCPSAPYEDLTVDQAEAKYAQFQAKGLDFWGRGPRIPYTAQDWDNDFRNEHGYTE